MSEAEQEAYDAAMVIVSIVRASDCSIYKGTGQYYIGWQKVSGEQIEVRDKARDAWELHQRLNHEDERIREAKPSTPSE